MTMDELRTVAEASGLREMMRGVWDMPVREFAACAGAMSLCWIAAFALSFLA